MGVQGKCEFAKWAGTPAMTSVTSLLTTLSVSVRRLYVDRRMTRPQLIARSGSSRGASRAMCSSRAVQAAIAKEKGSTRGEVLSISSLIQRRCSRSCSGSAPSCPEVRLWPLSLHRATSPARPSP